MITKFGTAHVLVHGAWHRLVLHATAIPRRCASNSYAIRFSSHQHQARSENIQNSGIYQSSPDMSCRIKILLSHSLINPLTMHDNRFKLHHQRSDSPTCQNKALLKSIKAVQIMSYFGEHASNAVKLRSEVIKLYQSLIKYGSKKKRYTSKSECTPYTAHYLCQLSKKCMWKYYI